MSSPATSPRSLELAVEKTFRVVDLLAWLGAHARVRSFVRASERPVLAALARRSRPTEP